MLPPASCPIGKYPLKPSAATAIPTISPSFVAQPGPLVFIFGSLVSKSTAMIDLSDKSG